MFYGFWGCCKVSKALYRMLCIFFILFLILWGRSRVSWVAEDYCRTLRWSWQDQQRAWSPIPIAWHVWTVSCKWFRYWVAPSSSSVVWLPSLSACSSWLHCLRGTKTLGFMLCNLWPVWSWSVALVSAARHWIRFEMTQRPIASTSAEQGARPPKTETCSGPRWEETRMVLQRCQWVKLGVLRFNLVQPLLWLSFLAFLVLLEIFPSFFFDSCCIPILTCLYSLS